MGKLVQGQWVTDDKLAVAEETAFRKSGGKFQRGTAGFRNWVTADGQAGPSGKEGFKAEPGRYHLFAALNCPWAHRTLIYRQVKKLNPFIGLSIVAPLRTDNGWVFEPNDNHPESNRFHDALFQLDAMHELYTKSNPDFTGRVTVPVLWDKKQNVIVSNESSEIIRMFNSAFNHISGDEQDFYPAEFAEEIDSLNDFIYQHINNGVYKAGFARSQTAYDEAVTRLFEALDTLEQRLSNRAYLLGENITEADWRLLPTLLRFDVGYYSAFKCNIRAIRDYPYLSAYLKDLYAQPGVGSTVYFDIYRRGYHSKSPLRNPRGITPIGFASPIY